MKRIEIKIVVDENQKEDLKRFISDCKKHGFEVTREGGGRLPNWSGWYASLEGENWCPLPDVEEKSDNLSRCDVCGNKFEAHESGFCPYCNTGYISKQ